MSNIAHVPKNSLHVEVARQPVIYVPEFKHIVVRHEMSRVVLLLNDIRVEMSTIIAHGIGMAISKALPGLELLEMIVIVINRRKVELLREPAMRVATALLRKADDADDWQLKVRKKLH